MKRNYLYLIFLASLLGCNSSSTTRAATEAPILTGTLTQTGVASLEAAASAENCDSGVHTVRIIDENEQITDVAVGSDCTFSATLPDSLFVYIQFLDSVGNLKAILSWQDPTQLNDGLSLKLSSWLKMANDQTHALGAISLIDTSSLTQSLKVRGIKFAGSGTPLTAIPELAPIGFDIDGDGIPDDNQSGFRRGSDTNGDGIPEISTTECTTAPTAPLYGRLLVKPIRKDSTDAEIAEIDRTASDLPDEVTLTSLGFELDAVPAQGDWVVLGKKTDTGNKYMVDANGDFTITSIPQGVTIAKVFKDLSHSEPRMHLPLCLLKTDPADVSNDTAITQRVPFPDPCFMDSTTSVCTEDDASANENLPFLTTEDPLETHLTCGASNAFGCCLDYDGYASTTGKPHNASRHMTAYIGSTCAAYVNANCCVGERGTVKNLVLGGLGVIQTIPCFANHVNRNCQNIDLGASCLVFSASSATRGNHDATTNPESITVACNENKTLFHHNNCCVNDDVISLTGCGTLDPVGTIQHGLILSGTSLAHETDRDLTYTAPAAPCTAVAKSEAWGYTRTINITVTCDGTTGTTTDDSSNDSNDSSTSTTTFTVDPSSTSFEHAVGTTGCPQSIGSVTVTNGSSQALSFAISSSADAVDVSPSTSSAAAGESTSFSLSFDCSQTTSLTGTITVQATGGDGQTSSNTVSVTGTIE